MSDDQSIDQFDFGANQSCDASADDIEALAHDLEQAEGAEPEDMSDDKLADYVAALKRLENAAEDARKDVFEDELEDRVEVGKSVGPLSRQSGRSTWVSDAEGAFAAVADAGEDPMSVADVSIGDLRDVLGDAQAEQFIGESEYSYFKRKA